MKEIAEAILGCAFLYFAWKMITRHDNPRWDNSAWENYQEREKVCDEYREEVRKLREKYKNYKN